VHADNIREVKVEQLWSCPPDRQGDGPGNADGRPLIDTRSTAVAILLAMEMVLTSEIVED
jgi:hypothetical protein